MSTNKSPQEGNTSSVALEPEVGIAIIGLFSATADKKGVSADEQEALTDFLGQIGLFDEYSDEDLENLTTEVAKLFKEEDPDDLIAQAIASLPDETYREAAYLAAILVAGIDEEIVEEEQEYISELQGALNISDERAQELIDEVFGEEEEEEE
jgi:tellurite resistance protein